MTKKSLSPSCCSILKNVHPDHSSQIARLNRISGQLAGVKKMIQERRYCPDILTQIKAACSAMRSLEASVLEGHIEGCVHSAMASNDAAQINKKVKELMKIFRGSSAT